MMLRPVGPNVDVKGRLTALTNVCLLVLVATIFSYHGAASQKQQRRQAGRVVVASQDIPVTKFSCNSRNPGYYADLETGCQVYHMCTEDGTQFSYRCPNTTLFQQRMLICAHWYQVNCSKSEQDYDANLLIGQKDKPFVGDAEQVNIHYHGKDIKKLLNPDDLQTLHYTKPVSNNDFHRQVTEHPNTVTSFHQTPRTNSFVHDSTTASSQKNTIISQSPFHHQVFPQLTPIDFSVLPHHESPPPFTATHQRVSPQFTTVNHPTSPHHQAFQQFTTTNPSYHQTTIQFTNTNRQTDSRYHPQYATTDHRLSNYEKVTHIPVVTTSAPVFYSIHQTNTRPITQTPAPINHNLQTKPEQVKPIFHSPGKITTAIFNTKTPNQQTNVGENTHSKSIPNNFNTYNTNETRNSNSQPTQETNDDSDINENTDNNFLRRFIPDEVEEHPTTNNTGLLEPLNQFLKTFTPDDLSNNSSFDNPFDPMSQYSSGNALPQIDSLTEDLEPPYLDPSSILELPFEDPEQVESSVLKLQIQDPRRMFFIPDNDYEQIPLESEETPITITIQRPIKPHLMTFLNTVPETCYRCHPSFIVNKADCTPCVMIR